MQNETEDKKTWQTPECVDLDVDKTSGKTVTFEEESGSYSGGS